MRKLLLPFAFCLLPFAADAACSRAALTQCLDSVCNIGGAMNPATRCQLCGTATAGGTATSTGIRSLSLGVSSKNTISATELKAAPNDPGAKYVWASEQCIAKITDCTPDDVSAAYDNLIEQSCRAAGVSADFAASVAASRRTKSQSACTDEINICMNTKNNDFDADFAKCTVQVSGCDEYARDIKEKIASERDAAEKSATTSAAALAKSYQTARADKLQSIADSCTNNAAATRCVSTVCANNMTGKCAAGFPTEKSMAELLCGFYNTACERIK